MMIKNKRMLVECDENSCLWNVDGRCSKIRIITKRCKSYEAR